MSPRSYIPKKRSGSVDQTRERILAAAREVLLSPSFSEFTMDAVAQKADVVRLTLYYQFKSKSGLLEALYDYLAKRGQMERMADIFHHTYDPIATLHEFILVFARFWGSDREVIRRLHALAAIDADIGAGLRLRNERRRQGLTVLIERYAKMYPMAARHQPLAIDILHMLTSFETYDALAGKSRSMEEVVAILGKMANQAIGFAERPLAR
jgi:AcrR family transcriptional regulator